jgi:hypothetical protein
VINSLDVCLQCLHKSTQLTPSPGVQGQIQAQGK